MESMSLMRTHHLAPATGLASVLTGCGSLALFLLPSLIALTGHAAPAGQLIVQASLKDPKGQVRAIPDAVVWLPGIHDRQSGIPTLGVRRVEQRQKEFQPHVEVVGSGWRVDFPNLDRVYHNVFSRSEIAPFDLGLYRLGATRSVTLTKPGVVRVYCNIHPQMVAYLIVVDSDFFAKTGADGRVEMGAVPVGSWPVRIWHEMSTEWEGRIEIAPGQATRLEVVLDGSTWRPAPHENKYGKPYPVAEGDEIRY